MSDKPEEKSVATILIEAFGLRAVEPGDQVYAAVSRIHLLTFSLSSVQDWVNSYVVHHSHKAFLPRS